MTPHRAPEPVRPSYVVTGLTLARLPLVALATWAAFEQDALATITFGAIAVATDIGDGILARRWGLTSDWGSNLDSFADFTFYSGLAFWTYLFATEPIERHLGLAAWLFAGYCVMLLAGWLLRGSIAVHDKVSRTAGTVGGFGALWIIAFGYHGWVLFAVVLAAVADLAHRLHATVAALGRRRRGVSRADGE